MHSCFVSLGYGCGVTASMSKYGLRSFAGPFDWCIQDLEAEMKILSEGFEGFMLKENLQIIPDKVPTFKDLSNGIIFPDEGFKDLDKEYPDIYEKYLRRIHRLKKQMDMGNICFIRAIPDLNELKYILLNEKQIKKSIGVKNDIIFFVPHYISVPVNPWFKYYILPFSRYTTDFHKSLRGYFDFNQDFIQYCIDNFDDNKRKDNLIYDLNAEVEFYRKRFSLDKFESRAMELTDAAWEYARSMEARYSLLTKVIRMKLEEINLPDKIIIYGAGDVGKVLYDKVKEKIKVEYFIDKYSKETEYMGCPIFSLEKITDLSEKTIVVTAILGFEEIKLLLKTYGDNISVQHVTYMC